MLSRNCPPSLIMFRGTFPANLPQQRQIHDGGGGSKAEGDGRVGEIGGESGEDRVKRGEVKEGRGGRGWEMGRSESGR